LNFEYLDSKDGVKTVKVNTLFLHSAYSPVKEAQRFCNNLKCSFKPSSIIITEPGLSYCLPFLRQSFPGIKIGAIRYTEEFSQYNSDFDFVIKTGKAFNLKNFLLQKFTEDNLFSVFFISWPASEKAFAEEGAKTWKEIKEALDTAKTLLVTRQFFEKKWLINSINFIKYAKNFYSLNKTSLPVLIAASGPSLKKSLPLIKNNQNKFIIIALSSAISVLLKNEIMPDFCISTDGGYWAGEHLKKLKKDNIPLALTAEAFCKKELLKNNRIIPLFYEDGISYSICRETSIPFIKACRNGTVSGTAMELALQLTSGKIYFSGLDLSEQKGFQHTQPNELELNSCLKDTYLSSKEKRISKSQFKNESLKIYQQWFSSFNSENSKIYRIISPELKKNSLGKICDISPEAFETECSLLKKEKEKLVKALAERSEKDRKADINNVINYIKKNSATNEWKKAIFPLDYTALMHNPENPENLQKIEKENSRLIEKLQKILEDE